MAPKSLCSVDANADWRWDGDANWARKPDNSTFRVYISFEKSGSNSNFTRGRLNSLKHCARRF